MNTMRFYFETREEMMKMVKRYENQGIFKKIADCYHAVILKGIYTKDELIFEII